MVRSYHCTSKLSSFLYIDQGTLKAREKNVSFVPINFIESNKKIITSYKWMQHELKSDL